MSQARPWNGAAKWFALLISAIAIVAGAVWHVATARAEITQNTERIRKLETVAADFAEMRIMIAKIAARLENADLLRKELP